jgi:hypothetical protein
MQVTSYTFKSPYPQAIQIGQPDPGSAKQEDSSQGTPALENQKSIVSEGKVNPTSGSGIAISLSALQSGNSRSGVSEFKALVNVNQGQKAYSEAS